MTNYKHERIGAIKVASGTSIRNFETGNYIQNLHCITLQCIANPPWHNSKEKLKDHARANEVLKMKQGGQILNCKWQGGRDVERIGRRQQWECWNGGLSEVQLIIMTLRHR